MCGRLPQAAAEAVADGATPDRAGGGVGGRSDPFDYCVRVGGFHLILHMVVEKISENLLPLA
jgi:hypothetical protein